LTELRRLSVKPGSEMAQRLIAAGLRPTAQRISLASLLFRGGDRHVSASSLYEDAKAARLKVSFATVYNTLNQFHDAGLLRQVAMKGERNFYDTNTSNHFHYYLEDSEALIDIDDSAIEVKGLPVPPESYEISRIDVVVRLRTSGAKDRPSND
jgi:Fur family iron response transcriptional regulator